MGSNSAPGFKTHPRSHIVTNAAKQRVRVIFRGEAIADTRDAVELKEGSYPAVYYIPRQDVKMDRLERTSHSTHCPFKGDAAYFSLKNGPDNAVWSYEKPFDEMTVIKDHLAFYPNKVDSIETS
jgi:uncharacterized protein (DUF427 family)